MKEGSVVIIARCRCFCEGKLAIVKETMLSCAKDQSNSCNIAVYMYVLQESKLVWPKEQYIT